MKGVEIIQARYGASKEVKNYGFKSVKQVAGILDLTPKTVFLAYRTDQARFWEYVKQAFEIKFIGE